MLPAAEERCANECVINVVRHKPESQHWHWANTSRRILSWSLRRLLPFLDKLFAGRTIFAILGGGGFGWMPFTTSFSPINPTARIFGILLIIQG